MIKVVKDNVVLSIAEEDLSQYEARGYTKMGAAKKVAPAELEKEITKLNKNIEELTKTNEKLATNNKELIEANENLTEANKNLTKKVEELTKTNTGVSGEKLETKKETDIKNK